MLSILLTIVVAAVLGHAVMLFVVGRSGSASTAPRERREPFYVFVVPALNEALVIERTLHQLLDFRGPDFAVLVVDDGSDDDTAAIVASIDDDRLWLLQRRLPHARRGKGEALNAGYRRLMSEGRLAAHSLDDIVVGIIDADGRLDPDAYEPLTRCFADPRVAAVQIRVRIHNAADSLLARLQDVEFAVFTEVFQRGRARLGTAGMGGNGQFVRLSALAGLGGSPWSACLTEDLELGIRLLLRGGQTGYCAETWVSQQGVVEPGALVRQRARWFQGHLQCWRLLDDIRLCTHLEGAPRRDLQFHLLAPALVLVVSLMVALGWLVGLGLAVSGAASGGVPGPVALLTMYLLGFGMVPLVMGAYRRAQPDIPPVRLALLSHLYLIYSLFWAVAGWRAVWHLARGRRRWAKTWRTRETGDEPRRAPVAPVPGRAAILVPSPIPASAAIPGPPGWPNGPIPSTLEPTERREAPCASTGAATAAAQSCWPVPSWRQPSAA